MSRRSRRRGVSDAGGAGWLLRGVMVLLMLFLVASGVFFAAVRGYLHSDAFRRMLSEKAGAAADVKGEFTPFRWDGLAVDSETFQGLGQGAVRDLRIDGLHTEVGLGGIGRGVWEIRDARMRRVAVTLDAAGGGTSTQPSQPAVSTTDVANSHAAKGGWLPRKVELKDLEIGQLDVLANLEQGLLTASGVKVMVKPEGGRNSFLAELTGGVVRPPVDLLPEMRLDEARLRHHDGAVFLTRLTASAWKEGRIHASGEWSGQTRLFSIQGDVSGVKCEDLLDETWAKRVIGVLSSDFTADNASGKAMAHGRLVLHGGTLTALPVLDILAAYADTRRFRVLSLSEAHADWRWEKDITELDDIVIASEGLARLEGRMSIRGRELDGTFRLGLMPGTLANIPGAETDVFTPGERGLLWAPLHVTGTLDKPREDLSDRLIAAAGIRMLETLPETGEKVIKFTRSVLGEHSSKTVEKGVEIIEKSGLGVREVSDILGGLLGGKERKKSEPEPAPEPQQ